MFPCMALTPEFIEEVRATLKSAMRETFGKQEAAAIEGECDPAQLSRELNGPSMVFLARCFKLGILPQTLEKFGARSTVTATLENHETRLKAIEQKVG